MILEFSHFSLAHCVDFNYRAGDKTDQTSIGDKTGRGRAKLYKVKIRWGGGGGQACCYSQVLRGEKL